MESIMYNKEDKEVVIILGYGIGNHLSLVFLEEIALEIKALFPMSDYKMRRLQFLQVAERSRRHRHMWYTRFKYDLNDVPKDDYGYRQAGDYKVLEIGHHKKGVDGWVHEDETAERVMNRLIHD